jgi:hypothetical protein
LASNVTREQFSLIDACFALDSVRVNRGFPPFPTEQTPWFENQRIEYTRTVVRGRSKEVMKGKLALASLFSICVLVLVVTPGCGGDGNDGKAAFGGNTQSQNNSSNAPLSLVGTTIIHNINTGTSPFTNSGIFSIQMSGTPGAISGDFRTFEPVGLPGSTGTFTSSTTSMNTSRVVFQDATLGIITEQFNFSTSTSGTFVRNLGPTASQTGTFSFH